MGLPRVYLLGHGTATVESFGAFTPQGPAQPGPSLECYGYAPCDLEEMEPYNDGVVYSSWSTELINSEQGLLAYSIRILQRRWRAKRSMRYQRRMRHVGFVIATLYQKQQARQELG